MWTNAPSEADRLITLAAERARRLTADELQLVLDHVSRAGFPPRAVSRVGSLGVGVRWNNRTLRSRDRVSVAEAHYIRHVLGRQEWPAGTTLRQYLDSIRQVILDDRSGVLTSHYQDAVQLTMIRRSGRLQGPAGSNWILVDYRAGLGHWVTAYQPIHGLRELLSPRRINRQWQRRPI